MDELFSLKKIPQKPKYLNFSFILVSKYLMNLGLPKEKIQVSFFYFFLMIFIFLLSFPIRFLIKILFNPIFNWINANLFIPIFAWMKTIIFVPFWIWLTTNLLKPSANWVKEQIFNQLFPHSFDYYSSKISINVQLPKEVIAEIFNTSIYYIFLILIIVAAVMMIPIIVYTIYRVIKMGIIKNRLVIMFSDWNNLYFCTKHKMIFTPKVKGIVIDEALIIYFYKNGILTEKSDTYLNLNYWDDIDK